MNKSLLLILSVLVVGGAAAVLALMGKQDKPAGTIVVYCAAGLKKPVEEAAARYEADHGVKVQLQYGGSNTLLANLKVTKTGDLYLPADDSYLDLARADGLITTEVSPVATMRPVLAVKAGNPANIRSLDDLSRDGVRVAVADAKAAAVGKVVRDALTAAGKWAAVERRVVVTKPTVNDIATDVQVGAADAAFVWDATVAQSNGALQAVPVPELADKATTVSVAVLKSAANPPAALQFLRYLSAADRGQAAFAKHGFGPADVKLASSPSTRPATTAGAARDAWDERPRLVVFAGAMLRPAIEDTIAEFKKREGVEVTTVYNGCGILVGQMKASGIL